MRRGRRRYRRNGSIGRMLRSGRRKGLLLGALWGAGAALLLTMAAGAAQGVPATAAFPKNAMAGAAVGAVASMLGARPVLAALTAGTGIYLVNTVRAASGGA